MNKQVITEQLLQAIWACENALSLKDDRFFAENEDRLKQNHARVTRAFSGSWIGYHANVYYHELQTPPPATISALSGASCRCTAIRHLRTGLSIQETIFIQPS